MANPSTDRLDHGSQGGMEGIAELLRCYICMERLTDATVCPHCLKLGCYSCIGRWVTDNRSDCPHCRTSLSLRDFIRIPLFDDIGQFLDTLRSDRSTSSLPSEEKEKCPTHKQKTTVYCESCKTCICHECALWSEEHRNHSFKPLEMLYKKHKEALQAELQKLKERMKDVLSHVQQMEKKMEGVKVNRSKTKRDMQHMVEKMYSRLDEHAKEKHARLSDYRHYLRNQAVEITRESHELEKKMLHGDIASLINTNGELKPDLKLKLHTLLNSSLQMEPMISSSDFVNEICPHYDSAIMKIHPFRELQRRGEEIYSKPLHAHGLTWRLKVYPNGHREDFGNYLAVYVELMDGFDKTTHYQYAIEMLFSCSNKYPNRNYKREYSSDFANGESWGYKKFYELSKLSEGFLKDDTLILRFSVRAPTYYVKCQDLILHIKKLESDKDALKQQLSVTRKQVEQLKNEKRSLMEARSVSSPVHTSGSTLQESTAHVSPHSRSHSAPHEHPLHHHTPRESGGRQRMESEETRRNYLSASQHHVAQGSPKRSSYLQHSVHSDSRLLSNSESHMAHTFYPGRRRSTHDASPEAMRLREQRRRSAEPVVLYDQTTGPFPSRSHTQPARGLSQSVQELQEHTTSQHESLGNTTEGSSATGGSDLTEGSGYRRKEYMRSESKKKTVQGRLPAANTTHARTGHMNSMFDSGSDEGGGGNSQPDLPLHTNDIYLDLEDNDDQNTVKSASSTSTLTAGAGSGSPPRNGNGTNGNKMATAATSHQQQQQLSQEPFGDEDPTEMMLAPLREGVPLASQPHYYENHVYTQYQGLSQPISPLKSKHGKSLTDIHAMTGSYTNLHSQQFLSQSVVEFPHYHQHRDMHQQQRYESTRHDGGRYVDPMLMNRSMMKHSQSSSHGRLHRMSSDSHLNYDGPPGTKASIMCALTRCKEEVEQNKLERRERERYQHGGHRRQQQSQSKGHQHFGTKLQKATVVSTGGKSGDASKYKSNSLDSPSHRRTHKTSATTAISSPPPPAASKSSAGTKVEQKSRDVSPSTHSKLDLLAPPGVGDSSSNLVAAGKSTSTSSLNLSQLL